MLKQRDGRLKRNKDRGIVLGNSGLLKVKKEEPDENEYSEASTKLKAIKMELLEPEVDANGNLIEATNEKPLLKPKIEIKKEIELVPSNEMCVFCRQRGHNSLICRRFRTATQRKFNLLGQNMCLRCLQPCVDGKNHVPCSRSEVACAYCVDKYNGLGKLLTHHHKLVCERFALEFQRQDKCHFCDVDSHGSVDCPVYTNHQTRRNRLIARKRCIRCLCPNNKRSGRAHNPCTKTDDPCQHCWEEGKSKNLWTTNHHDILCPRHDWTYCV